MTKYLCSLGICPLAQNSSIWEYLIPDALGSVRQIVNGNGYVTLAESYESYGTVWTRMGTVSSIFDYAVGQTDIYSKLLFLIMLSDQATLSRVEECHCTLPHCVIEVRQPNGTANTRLDNPFGF
jgi:hypothetical protein